MFELVGGLLAKAIPLVIALWEAHGQDEKAALDALEVALAAARAKNDADLRKKHEHDAR